MLGFHLAQGATRNDAGIHVDVHGLPGVLVNHVDAIGAIQIFAESMNVFLEFCIQVYFPQSRACMKSSQYAVEEQFHWFPTLSHMKQLSHYHPELVQVHLYLVHPIFH